MRYILSLFILLCTAFASSASVQERRVAILVSSYGEEGRENLSYDLEELAQAYLVLYENGVKIDIISPKGGPVLVHNKKDDLPYIQKFKNETPALKQLGATLASDTVTSEDYDGILVVGGDGAMFDLPVHEPTTFLINEFAAINKPITAVCHGPAALVNAKAADGSYLVSGRHVNSFTNLEEQAFGGDVIDQLPFLLEDKLKERGAIYMKNAPMLPYVAVDGSLITAQNPMAVANAAEALLVQLGITPKERQLFKDEATMKLVQEARISGPYLIDVALKKSPELYDLNYLALYGFYSYKLAESDEAKKLELEIMQAVSRHFSHPMYSYGLIEALNEQGYPDKAHAEFNRATTMYPESQELQSLRTLFE
ncbi:type 1 glutamine amidotransferase domain-containing protein [Kordiimonas sp. SCSIO 12603]|uniref:type 1 glutamine amidotransferase domain-containing protein n=1 Tax=Kordiimonas sp. SCSIO 12603 TaxID=2829596 RepID=UPI002106B1D1|nr:type 1 glutamine amidotransferase domain-containing protein [Kordiimonas sp. SCSIO 12603]UTW57119.1 type 1 glutamine amidotransferase domain-containing protein [Kordiimonas sp. SCSIO 12603]